jgi:2-iminobutanoate/2-iminopropanoate deaminase
MRTVHPPGAPPAGHYSPGIVARGLVFVSGQVAEGPDAGAQTRAALHKVRGVLEAAGARLEHLVQLTVFVHGMEHWDAVNAAVAEVLGAHRPTRAIIPAGDFGDGYLVELTAIAALPE